MSNTTDKLKIIFLDFDGVLQIEKYDDPWMGTSPLLDGYSDRDVYGLLFDKGCVLRLAQLIEKTQAKIVISSSWRFEGKEAMFNLWNDRNMPGAIIDITAFDDDYQNQLSRGAYIQHWLDDTDVDHYVILDDVDNMLDHQKEHLVLTNYKMGFQEEDLERAIQIMSK